MKDKTKTPGAENLIKNASLQGVWQDLAKHIFSLLIALVNYSAIAKDIDAIIKREISYKIN